MPFTLPPFSLITLQPATGPIYRARRLPGASREHTVDHDGQSLDPRLPTGPGAGIKDDRSGALLGELAFDRPEQLLAPPRVAFDRLLLDQLIDLRVAVAVPVQVRTASVKQIEESVGV